MTKLLLATCVAVCAALPWRAGAQPAAGTEQAQRRFGHGAHVAGNQFRIVVGSRPVGTGHENHQRNRAITWKRKHGHYLTCI